MTSPATSSRHLSKFKKRPKMSSDSFGFPNSLSEDHEISGAYRRPSTPQASLTWHDWLLLVGCKLQFNTAQKCVKRVRPVNSRISRSTLFNVEFWILHGHRRRPIVYSNTGYDVINYFRSAFLELGKNSRKCPPPTDLCRILVARRFACPTNWRGAC